MSFVECTLYYRSYEGYYWFVFVISFGLYSALILRSLIVITFYHFRRIFHCFKENVNFSMELIEDIQRRNLHKSAKRVETEGFFQLQRIEELSSPFVGFYK